MGTLAMTLAWLSLGQAPGDPQYINMRDISIPITFQDSRRAELREIMLFASWDEGRTYQQVASVKPDQNRFVFRAPNDGACWLQVACINRQGKQEPENIQQWPPKVKFVIDTMKPVVRVLTARRQGEEIAIAWEILEDHFDPQAFQLEYQAKDSLSFWTRIQAAPGLVGQAHFRPPTSGPIVVRLVAKDLAGNQSFSVAEVAGDIRAVSFSPNNGAAPTSVAPPVLPAPAPPPTIGTSIASPVPPPLPADTLKQPQTSKHNWTAVTPDVPSGPPEKLVATSREQVAPPPVVVPPVNEVVPVAAIRKLPPLKYVNRPEVVLDYQLAKVGKSGIGSVDLWWTRNDGQSWELYATDPEAKGSTQSGIYQRTVELPGKGVYGFILVVKSRAGLGKAPPKLGDIPEIRVEVDTTPPLAELFAPSPDPEHPNALVLKWNARDDNLTYNPITLEWAEKREGPWHSIADAIPNDGRYSWQPPDVLPVAVYLRLRVRDLAENESVAVTPEPQLVDLSEPEGKLLNVTVVPRRP